MKKLIAFIAPGIVLLAGVTFWVSRHTGSTTVGQSVNATIDNLQATGVRLVELPTFLLLMWVAILGSGLAIIVARFATTSRRVTVARISLITVGLVILFGLALIADRKINRLQAQVDQLRSKLQNQQLVAKATPGKGGGSSAVTAIAHSGVMGTGTEPPTPNTVEPAAPRDLPMFDVDQVPRTLTSYFGNHNFQPMIYDQATDIIKVAVANPPIVAYMAIIDLRTPGLELKLGGSTTTKTLTSEFAHNNQCTIAINGEAGASPRLNSGFGTWIGNFITQGQVLIKEQPTNKRPFLSFDKQNHGTFTAMASANRALPADPFNVIWGRLDAVIGGVVQTENERDRQPRTGMGIDKDGTHLYLMVVDGRQQRFSVGFTRAEVGLFLQAFGAFNGMLCDEGGSSCIYIKNFGGITNSPSDGDERETYTHFGVSLH